MQLSLSKFFLGLWLLGLGLQPAYAADNAGLVAIPGLQSRVTDLTGVLESEQKATLEKKLAEFEKEKGAQIAILILPTTAPETIDQYSMRVVEDWKIGREKVDDGVLFLMALEDRRLRLEIGYGLEGVLPDVICKRIIADLVTPHFKKGNFYAGIDTGVEALFAAIRQQDLPEPGRNSPREIFPINALTVLLLFFFLAANALLSFGKKRPGLTLLLAAAYFAANWLILATLAYALLFLAIFLALALGKSRGTGWHSGGSGSWGGGSSGGFSGGGGSFGGGGSSGSW